jgi:uncharacterized protein YbjT (DUF2867 family)
MSTILVTGATGNIGSHLVGELQRRGEPVRAFVRDPGRARMVLGPGVELAIGDYADPASVEAALDGVDRLFLLTPTHPEMAAWESTLLDAAAPAGVRRVVKMSTRAAEPGSTSRFARWQSRCEELLRASGIPAVTLQSSNHMTNVLFSADTIRALGKIFAPLGDATIAMIDRRGLTCGVHRRPRPDRGLGRAGGRRARVARTRRRRGRPPAQVRTRRRDQRRRPGAPGSRAAYVRRLRGRRRRHPPRRGTRTSGRHDIGRTGRRRSAAGLTVTRPGGAPAGRHGGAGRW